MRSSNVFPTLVRFAIGIAIAASSTLASSQGRPVATPYHDATNPTTRGAALPRQDSDPMSYPGSGGGTTRIDVGGIDAHPGSGGGTTRPHDAHGVRSDRLPARPSHGRQ